MIIYSEAFAQAGGHLVIFCRKWGMGVYPSMGLYSREYGIFAKMVKAPWLYFARPNQYSPMVNRELPRHSSARWHQLLQRYIWYRLFYLNCTIFPRNSSYFQWGKNDGQHWWLAIKLPVIFMFGSIRLIPVYLPIAAYMWKCFRKEICIGLHHMQYCGHRCNSVEWRHCIFDHNDKIHYVQRLHTSQSCHEGDLLFHTLLVNIFRYWK